jgi:diadenosine tetraphosphate (Ap4A) HIT family hydrolase
MQMVCTVIREVVDVSSNEALDACLFCLRGTRRIRDEEILARAEGGYLIKALPPKLPRLFGFWPKLRNPHPPVYVVIPFLHTYHVDTLPDDWQRSVNHLIWAIPEFQDWQGYTLAYSNGAAAGAEIVGHVHGKVIPRGPWENGRSSARAGTEKLIRLVNQRWWHRLFW